MVESERYHYATLNSFCVMQKYMRTGWFFLFLEQAFLHFGQESVFIQQFDGDFIATQ